MPKYKTIPDLMTPTQVGKYMWRTQRDGRRTKGLKHVMVRRLANRGEIGYFKICGRYYFTRDDLWRYNEAMPPIPQNKR